MARLCLFEGQNECFVEEYHKENNTCTEYHSESEKKLCSIIFPLKEERDRKMLFSQRKCTFSRIWVECSNKKKMKKQYKKTACEIF